MSVIVPNYNHGRFLRQRMESILNQSFKDFELIYLDDASTDDSAVIFEEYRSRSNISAHFNTSNSGSPFRQWNRGVREAKGEFVWIAESDDVAEPELLSTLVGGLESRPECGVAYCRSKIVDDEGKDTGLPDHPEGPRWDTDFVRRGSDELNQALSRSNTIPNASAVVFRKDLFDQVGGAPSDMRYAGDWMLWCRMLAVSDVFYSASPLNRFRQHSRTQRHSAQRSGLWAEEGYRVLRYLKSAGVDAGSMLDEGLDDMVRKWLESTYARGGGMTREAHRTVAQAARKVDPHVVGRVVRRLSPSRPLPSLQVLRALLEAYGGE